MSSSSRAKVAFNRQTSHYGLLIQQEKYLLKYVFRQHCYLKTVERSLTSSVEEGYFLSFFDALNRSIRALPVEKLSNLDIITFESVSIPQESGYLFGWLKDEDSFGLVFLNACQVGDVLHQTTFFELLPDNFLLPFPASDQVLFLPLQSILSAAVSENPFKIIRPKDIVLFQAADTSPSVSSTSITVPEPKLERQDNGEIPSISSSSEHLSDTSPLSQSSETCESISNSNIGLKRNYQIMSQDTHSPDSSSTSSETSTFLQRAKNPRKEVALVSPAQTELLKELDSTSTLVNQMTTLSDEIETDHENSTSNCDRSSNTFLPTPTTLVPPALPKRNGITLPTIEEILASYQITCENMPNVNSNTFPKFSGKIPSYIPDNIMNFQEYAGKERTEFNDRWFEAQPFWKVFWQKKNPILESYVIPRFLTFRYSKLIPQIQNLDFFYFKDMMTHLAKYNCLSSSPKELWKDLQGQGWKSVKVTIPPRDPNEKKKEEIYYRYVPAKEFIVRYTKGFHEFHSFRALMDYISRFPYLMENDQELMKTLKIHRWVIHESGNTILYKEQWKSVGDMRKLFWTFPHLFFHHYIQSDEDKDRLLLSIGLPSEYADTNPNDASVFPRNRTYSDLLWTKPKPTCT
eukprot:gene8464-9159_t